MMILAGALVALLAGPACANTFFAAPGATDNGQCTRAAPCTPQGAVLACHAQSGSVCHVQLADGIYLDPEINIFYYRFISVTGNCDSPQAVVLRATKPGILVRRRTMNTIRMVLVADMAARGAWSEL